MKTIIASIASLFQSPAVLLLMFLFIVMFNPLSNWVLINLLKTHNIATASTRKLAESVAIGFIWVSVFAVGFGAIGMPYGLFSFLLVWTLLSVIEYVMPNRRR